jgi:hypothetical protein
VEKGDRLLRPQSHNLDSRGTPRQWTERSVSFFNKFLEDQCNIGMGGNPAGQIIYAGRKKHGTRQRGLPHSVPLEGALQSDEEIYGAAVM